jgi:tetratricopeptide (TPR) repeat protein
MSGNLIYFIGVALLIVGTALTYYGSNLKSTEDNKRLTKKVEELKVGNKELIEGKNTLIVQNKKLTAKVEEYQKDLEEKEEKIKELEVKVKKSERGISSIYDFNGAKRTTTLGRISVVVGPEVQVFQIINALEKRKNYLELIKLCEQQIKETPEWLTPYYYLGIAYANTGNEVRAIELFEYVLKNAPGDTNYSQSKDFLKKLKE